MRRILSTVLILMLVLRGLLGDAMAMGMVPVVMPVVMHHEQSAPTAMSEHAEHDMAGMHEQTMSMADHCTDVSASMQQCGGSKHLGATCSACDICNTTLHTAAELVLSTSAAPQSLQATHSTRFVSALPAQVAKPPIF